VFTFQIFGKQVDRAISDVHEIVNIFRTVTERTDLTYGDLICVSEFRPNMRMVNKFGAGRVFVVGGPFPFTSQLTRDLANGPI
jgi:hypothetical protein